MRRSGDGSERTATEYAPEASRRVDTDQGGEAVKKPGPPPVPPSPFAITTVSGDKSADEVVGAISTALFQPTDVVFVFGPPRGHGFQDQVLRLYANTPLLSSKCQYFDRLFQAGTCESEVESSTSRSIGPPVRQTDPEDSDEETDRFHFPDRGVSWEAPIERHKVIPVTSASYTTYAAVIFWLYTGRIRFAPLATENLIREESEVNDRLGSVKAALQDRPSFPAPSSAKSVYRLAHMLDLPDLQQIAGEDFVARLSPRIAPLEYFSRQFGHGDEDLTTLTKQLLAVKWAEARVGEGMKAVDRMVAEGRIDDKTFMNAQRELLELLGSASVCRVI